MVNVALGNVGCVCQSALLPAHRPRASGRRVSPGIFLLVSHGEDSSKLQKVRAALKIHISACARMYFWLLHYSTGMLLVKRRERPEHR